jgi:hypothetical protein
MNSAAPGSAHGPQFVLPGVFGSCGVFQYFSVFKTHAPREHTSARTKPALQTHVLRDTRVIVGARISPPAGFVSDTPRHGCTMADGGRTDS